MNKCYAALNESLRKATDMLFCNGFLINQAGRNIGDANLAAKLQNTRPLHMHFQMLLPQSHSRHN